MEEEERKLKLKAGKEKVDTIDNLFCYLQFFRSSKEAQNGLDQHIIYKFHKL